MKISLIGFMGSGKTSVGHELAKILGFEFVEMDTVVLERAKFKNMQELFDSQGETHLREWEISLAKEWQKKENAVISTGGGVVMNRIIIDYLKKGKSHIVFLHAPFTTLEARVVTDKTPRPLFRNGTEAYRLLRFRLPLYKRYSDFIIRTKGKNPQKIAQEIILKLYKNESPEANEASPLREVVEQIMKVRNL